MSFKEAPELKRFVIQDVQHTGKKLGHGAFGGVEELIIGGTYYAGKRLHDIFLEQNNEGAENILGKFVSECRLLSDIRHPNIVQFMGICFFEDNPYPVLVMERLDTDLDSLLSNGDELPFSLKLQILCDISKGLVYLHGQADPIVHRDLTTRNVLINKDSMNAKIADLGNARIIEKKNVVHILSQAPGTLVYMPPEALELNPLYDTSLDIFSFGHLALYTINQVFPEDLLNPTYKDLHTHQLHPRSEIARRKQYIDMLLTKLGPDHSLTCIIQQCLSNIKDSRPSAKHIMEELEKLITMQYDPYSEFAKVSRLSLVQQINKKSQDTENHDSGASEKAHIQDRATAASKNLNDMSPGILEIQRNHGHIHKKHVWKKYIFQIEGSCLKYLKGSRIKDYLNLKNVTSVNPLECDDTGIFRFSVCFTGRGSPWTLQAYSKGERNRWMKVLKTFMPKSKVELTDYEMPVDATNLRNRPLPEMPLYCEPTYTYVDDFDFSLLESKAKDKKEQPHDGEVEKVSHTLEISADNNPLTSAIAPKSDSIPPKDVIQTTEYHDQAIGEPIVVPSDKSPEDQSTNNPITFTVNTSPVHQHEDSNLLDQSRAHGDMEPTEHKTPHRDFEPSPIEHRTSSGSSCYVSMESPFSLEGMSKEQLLEYIQTLPSSQPPESYLSSHPISQKRLSYSYSTSSDEQNEEYASESTSKRGQLYVNLNFDSAENQERPPPIPPRPGHYNIPKPAESNSLQRAAARGYREEGGVKKSQSVHLRGYRRPLFDQEKVFNQHSRGNVKFMSFEDDQDEVFSQHRNLQGGQYRPSSFSSHNHPPLPPKSHRKGDGINPTEIGRSHTMRAFLPSEMSHIPYRKKFTSIDTIRYPHHPNHGTFMHGNIPERGLNEGKRNGEESYYSSRRQQIPTTGQTDRPTRLEIAQSMDAPSSSPFSMEDIQVFGHLLMNERKMNTDQLLYTMDKEEDEDERPEWATCMSGPKVNSGPSTPEESLESLQKLAFFIAKKDLHEMHQIGKGQFGKVYRAKLYQGSAGVDVAVKTIKKYESEKECTEFLREQGIMSQMAHPNVVRLFGLVQQESPWIVLEYLPHGDLKYFLMKNEKPVKSLIKYMLDVALGMHYISEKGLVHRDIAARNIMVGHSEICKVGDFGLLRELPKDEDIYISVNKTPAPIRWMAPESLEKREFSPATDVWSYGILLWEMYQPFKLPYEEMDNYKCGISVIQGYRLDIPFKYPLSVKRMMRACWHTVPEKRPSFLLIFNILTRVTFS